MQQTADLIRQRRRELGLTQAALAERIHVSAKAVSKWERGAGMPDASIVPSLSAALGISAEGLLSGLIDTNPPNGGNMKRIRFYQCPACGNLMTALGTPELSCCGRRLSPMQVTAADAAHTLTITDIETEKLLTWQHPMDKAHHLTFLAAVGTMPSTSSGCTPREARSTACRGFPAHGISAAARRNPACSTKHPPPLRGIS